MAVTGTRTLRQLVTRGLRLAGVLDFSEDADAVLAANALQALDDMLKGWQPQPWMWTRAGTSLTLTTAASYTLSPVRPLRIITARLKRGGIETPMTEMTQREYDELPQKDVTGLPTTYFYDRQREAAVFYVWPVLSAAAGETVEITYEREIEDATDLDAVADIPGEWWEAVVYNLADRIGDEAGRTLPKITARAEELRRSAAAGAMTESVFFGPDH